MDRENWVRAGEAAWLAGVTRRTIEFWASKGCLAKNGPSGVLNPASGPKGRRTRLRRRHLEGWDLYSVASLRRYCGRRGKPFPSIERALAPWGERQNFTQPDAGQE